VAAREEEGGAMREEHVLEAILEAPAEQPGDEFFPQVAGALIGAAAADALGWITEFVRGPDHLRKLYGTDRVDQYRAWQKRSGGRFNTYLDRINPGEYSDDTQLTLAVARSLLPDGSIDLEHFSKMEMPLWLDYARGAGATITAAARAIGRKTARWNANFFSYRQGGRELSYQDSGANGAAMRVGPIALANIRDPDQTSLGVWQTSIVTHGHPRAILGALVHAEALRLCAAERTALRREELLGAIRAYVENVSIPEDRGITEWLRRWDEGEQQRSFEPLWAETTQEVLAALGWIAEAHSSEDIPRILDALGCFRPETKGSGTGTALAGLLIFSILGHDFSEAVVTAINQLGTDTDTIGGFVGGLCGAWHGYENVPPEWASELQDYDYLVRVATELARVSARAGVGGQALLPKPGTGAKPLPNLLDRLRERSVAKGERIYHPLFGTGWVEFVEEQALRRRDGAEAIFAYVRFDIGQTCKFRFIRIPKKRRTTAPRRGAQETAKRGKREDQLSFGGKGGERANKDDPRHLLSSREMELLKEVASGRTTRELAATLGISSASVVAHLRRIFEKLGVHHPGEALTEARRRGLL
jgi:ADP-ribosylglycohydrolase/DNA-binding CsgD family transcriptional regulator